MIHRYGNILRLPNDESSDSRKRDQRLINRPRRIRNRQECNTRDPIREEQCHPRHPSPIHLSQKPRRLPIPRHIQHRPRRHIQRRIPRTQHRNDNHRVNYRRPRIDPRRRKRNRKWRLRGFGSRRQQIRIVPGDQDAEEEHHADVEDQDAPEYLADGAGDGDAWVGRFAGCDADHFGAGVEGSCYYEGFGDAGGGGGEGAGCEVLASMGSKEIWEVESERLCQYLKPIFWGPMTPELMKTARMKKIVMLMILILMKCQ